MSTLREFFKTPFGIALARGVYSGAVIGGIAMLTTLQVTDDASGALIVGGITFLTTLGARTGVEGVIDTRAARP